MKTREDPYQCLPLREEVWGALERRMRGHLHQGPSLQEEVWGVLDTE